MQITKAVYEKILLCCNSVSYESGGVLGGKDDVVSEFVFDFGVSSGEPGCYYPNVAFLNRVINDWQYHNIVFYGIVHCHFQEEEALSLGDEEYISQIMKAMSPRINHLFFPLVLPKNRLISFVAERVGNEVKVDFAETTIL